MPECSREVLSECSLVRQYPQRSSDERFVIKTVKGMEKDFFLSSKRNVIKQYCDHMISHPDTLLCKFYGLFKIRFLNDAESGHRSRHGPGTASGVWTALIVMPNCLLSPLEVHLKYDLKGSTNKRYVDDDEQKKGVSVLKQVCTSRAPRVPRRARSSRIILCVAGI